MENSLDPDQARHFVRPDLDPNCLQKLSAVDTIVGKELTFLFYSHLNQNIMLWVLQRTVSMGQFS